MSQELDLKEIERKAWLSVFQDGLYDLWLGWLVLWWGVIYLLSRTDLSTPVMTIINLGGYSLSAIVLYLAKRFITVPRIGRVRFGRRRRSRLVLVGLIAAIIVNLAFGLTVLAIARQQSLLGESLSPFVAPLLLSLFFLVLFGLPAYLLEYNRLYLVAVMFALPELLRTAFQKFWGLNLGFLARAIPAAVVITVGLVTFLRFLREHPAPAIPAGEKDERCQATR